MLSYSEDKNHKPSSICKPWVTVPPPPNSLSKCESVFIQDGFHVQPFDVIDGGHTKSYQCDDQFVKALSEGLVM